MHDTQTARAHFTQTVTDKNGRMVQQASGEFAIARPGKFRWSVDKPYQQLLVGDGERVWIYDPDLNQVVKRRNDQALGSTPAALLAGRDDVERAFDWRDLPAADGLDGSARRPGTRSPRSATFAWASMRAGLAALEILDNFGQRTHIRFTGLERNPKLPPDLFRFTPPAGRRCRRRLIFSWLPTRPRRSPSGCARRPSTRWSASATCSAKASRSPSRSRRASRTR